MKFEKFPFKIEKQYRLSGYDYSQNGYYFITICVKDRLNILGSVGTDLCVCSLNKKQNKNININLFPFGEFCRHKWKDIPNKFNNVILDDFIIMPNHIHGIIVINNKFYAQTHGSAPTINTKFGNVGLLGQIIRWFKTMTTNEYIKNVKQNNWPKFQKHLWQSRFHDRIIRNEKEYFAIKRYIKNNSANWNKKIIL